MVRMETQAKETTFQFSVTQPADLNGDAPTHGDILNLVAGALQGPGAVEFFIDNGLSVLRVGDIRSIYWNNDQDRNEQNPSFDIVFKSNDVYINGVPVIDTFTFETIPVPNLI